MQACNYWAGKWVQQQEYLGVSKEHLKWGFIILASLATILMVVRRAFMGCWGAKASYNLFALTFNSVLNQPMSWFDVTTPGQILGTLAENTSQTDFQTPLNIGVFLDLFSNFVVCCILVMILIPYLAILAVVLMILLYLTMRVYLRTSVDIRKISLDSLSPLINKITEMANSLEVLRAFNKLAWIKRSYESLLEINTSAQIHEKAIGIWMNFRLQLMTSVFCSVAPFLLALSKTEHWKVDTSSSTVVYGTILSGVFLLSNDLSTLAYSYGEIAKGMSSVQRLVEYIRLNSASLKRTKIAEVNHDWPSKGKVEIDNMSVRYGEGPLVLEDMTLTIDTWAEDRDSRTYWQRKEHFSVRTSWTRRALRTGDRGRCGAYKGDETGVQVENRVRRTAAVPPSRHSDERTWTLGSRQARTK
jgi:ABC-type multidrug transport system fused ATPase/permease subunit